MIAALTSLFWWCMGGTVGLMPPFLLLLGFGLAGMAAGAEVTKHIGRYIFGKPTPTEDPKSKSLDTGFITFLAIIIAFLLMGAIGKSSDLGQPPLLAGFPKDIPFRVMLAGALAWQPIALALGVLRECVNFGRPILIAGLEAVEKFFTEEEERLATSKATTTSSTEARPTSDPKALYQKCVEEIQRVRGAIPVETLAAFDTQTSHLLKELKWLIYRRQTLEVEETRTSLDALGNLPKETSKIIWHEVDVLGQSIERFTVAINTTAGYLLSLERSVENKKIARELQELQDDTAGLKELSSDFDLPGDDENSVLDAVTSGRAAQQIANLVDPKLQARLAEAAPADDSSVTDLRKKIHA